MSTSQFSLPTNKTYDGLIDKYKIYEMEGFMKYEDLKSENLSSSSIDNPKNQKGSLTKFMKGGKLNVASMDPTF